MYQTNLPKKPVHPLFISRNTEPLLKVPVFDNKTVLYDGYLQFIILIEAKSEVVKVMGVADSLDAGHQLVDHGAVDLLAHPHHLLLLCLDVQDLHQGLNGGPLQEHRGQHHSKGGRHKQWRRRHHHRAGRVSVSRMLECNRLPYEGDKGETHSSSKSAIGHNNLLEVRLGQVKLCYLLLETNRVDPFPQVVHYKC